MHKSAGVRRVEGVRDLRADPDRAIRLEPPLLGQETLEI